VLPPDNRPERPRQRFVDRVWSLQAVIVVALVALVLGGLAGAGLASVGDHQDRRVPHGRFQRGGPMMPPGGQRWRWDDGSGQQWRMPRGQVPRPWGPGGRRSIPPLPSPAPSLPSG